MSQSIRVDTKLPRVITNPSIPPVRPVTCSVVRIDIPCRLRSAGHDGTYGVTRRLNQHLTLRRLAILLGLRDGYEAGGVLGRRDTHIDALWQLLDDIGAAIDAAEPTKGAPQISTVPNNVAH